MTGFKIPYYYRKEIKFLKLQIIIVTRTNTALNSKNTFQITTASNFGQAQGSFN